MDLERFLNPALNDAPPDESVTVCDEADRMEAQGAKIIHMDLGRPDFDTPQRVKARAIAALENGRVHYTQLNGVPELKQAIAGRCREEQGLILDPDDNILVTVGASEALFHIWMDFLRPGDEIIIPTPCYCAYLYILACLGVKCVEVPIVKGDQVQFDINDLRAAVTERTRMIVVNTPQNPTGLVLTREQLGIISDFAKENDLLVVSDECYDHFLYSGEHLSIATLPGMFERTITVNSVSKTYSMTGWRVGYAAASKEIIDIMAVSHGNLILCAPSFAQYGAAEAFANVKDELNEMRDEFIRRRACVVQWMERIGVLPYVKPEGAFYLFFDISCTGMDGLTFCMKLLEEYHVNMMPGSIYGGDYHNYVRLAFTCSYEDVDQGMRRLAQFVEKYRIR